MNITLPEDVAHRVTVLTDRASSLRSQADELPKVLATSYRRRASELELEAFALELRAGGLVEPAAA